MIQFIDNQLNRITMYRLVLYYLIALLIAAFFISLANAFSFDPLVFLFSVAFLVGASAITNRIFSRTFGIAANVESVYISALILALIITPPQSLNDLLFLGWAALVAIASKYIVAYKAKHLFNPTAFAIALTSLALNRSASWWVGSGPMLPFVVVGGLLIVRKLGWFDMLLSFLGAALIAIWVACLLTGNDFIASVQRAMLYSPLLFFGFIILSEPSTTPPNRKLRIYYGGLVGLLFAPQLHIGSLFMTPELAILVGNLFSFIVSPKGKLMLRLKERERIAQDTYEFVFAIPRHFAFAPGQYMEWTLGHKDTDDRGNRRYFTLASAPTERNLRLGIKFYQKSSSFKTAMLGMNKETEIIASQLAGSFVLPEDPEQKCVFLAGGIGITPFRSMIKYLLDIHQSRPIVLFYSAKNFDDLVYKDIFDRAQRELGINTIYTVSENPGATSTFQGKIGRVSGDQIRASVPDFRNSIYYISGPRGMVDSFRSTLRRLGIAGHQIKTDYFAGLA
jgi:glycine betaine catabolism B